LNEKVGYHFCQVADPISLAATKSGSKYEM